MKYLIAADEIWSLRNELWRKVWTNIDINRLCWMINSRMESYCKFLSSTCSHDHKQQAMDSNVIVNPRNRANIMAFNDGRHDYAANLGYWRFIFYNTNYEVIFFDKR